MVSAAGYKAAPVAAAVAAVPTTVATLLTLAAMLCMRASPTAAPPADPVRVAMTDGIFSSILAFFALAMKWTSGLSQMRWPGSPQKPQTCFVPSPASPSFLFAPSPTL